MYQLIRIETFNLLVHGLEVSAVECLVSKRLDDHTRVVSISVIKLFCAIKIGLFLVRVGRKTFASPAICDSLLLFERFSLLV